MRQFVENTEPSSEPMDRSIFAPAVVGERYKKRLDKIWANRNVTRGAKKLQLRF
jgi:hypothetical protein